jgi:hypothetical protein
MSQSKWIRYSTGTSQHPDRVRDLARLSTLQDLLRMEHRDRSTGIREERDGGPYAHGMIAPLSRLTRPQLHRHRHLAVQGLGAPPALMLVGRAKEYLNDAWDRSVRGAGVLRLPSNGQGR